MDKNRIIVVVLCVCLNIISLFGQKVKSKVVKNKCVYVESAAFNNSHYYLLEHQHNSEKYVVRESSDAASVAFVYVSNLYGKKLAKIEQPYDISILNDSLWLVSGSSKPVSKYKQWKGSFTIIINRKTGGLVSFMHEKWY